MPASCSAWSHWATSSSHTELPPRRTSGGRVARPDGATRPAGANAAEFLATFILIFVAMGALFAVDLFLAGKERGERRSEARHFYMEGLRSARLGKQAQAVGRFQSGLSNYRDK